MVISVLDVLDLLYVDGEKVDTTILRLLVDPEGSASTLQSQQPESDGSSGGDSDGINYSIDIFETENILKLLSGQTTDLVSLSISESMDLGRLEYSLPKVPVGSLFGVINGFLQVDLVLDFMVNAFAQMGFDTNGFFVSESGDDYLFDVEAGIGGNH